MVDLVRATRKGWPGLLFRRRPTATNLSRLSWDWTCFGLKVTTMTATATTAIAAAAGAAAAAAAASASASATRSIHASLVYIVASEAHVKLLQLATKGEETTRPNFVRWMS